MSKTLELAQDKFLNRVGNMCSKFGLNDFMAQLYALLYLHKEPLSLDDLAERLKASKGNVSINVRQLQSWGAVRKIWVKGSRKDYYEAEPDVKKVIMERITSSFQKRISEVKDMLQEFNDTIASVDGDLTIEEKEIVKNYQIKLKKIEEINSLVSNLYKVADRLL